MTDATVPKPRRTGAQAEETALLLVYTLRDALMHRYDFGERQATEWADTLVNALREKHGGEEVYIKAADCSERNAAIRAELRTGNAADVAKRHGLSIQSVYRIAAEGMPGP